MECDHSPNIFQPFSNFYASLDISLNFQGSAQEQVARFTDPPHLFYVWSCLPTP
jgi:hypothetical protein